MTDNIMPPRIVIGLTGPVGSGCSTLSKFFDDPDDFERMNGNLLLQKLVSDNCVSPVKDNYIVNWDDINKQVDEKLKQYHLLKDRIGKLDESSIPEKLFLKRNKIFKELGRLLEQRESLKAFSFLKPYYPQGKTHCFRTLSMSDLIIFHSLLSMERKPNISSGYKEFDAIAKKIMPKIEEEMKELELPDDIDTVTKFYNKISEKNNPTNIKLLIRVFKTIHRYSRELKSELQKKTCGRYTEILQAFGNNLRKCGSPFVCPTDQDATKNATKLAQDMAKVINLVYESGEASFFVVDCLRNPYEVLYFRKMIPDFYLVSIYADQKVRLDRTYKDHLRVLGKSLSEEDYREKFSCADALDSGKNIQESIEKSYKQNVTKCVQISDYAINNLEDCLDKETVLHIKMLRMLLLILSPGCSKPTLDEVHMNMAYTMAVKSNCICRQVGAVIVGADGYVVGAGWNDVAKGDVSCGLRALRDIGNSQIHKPIDDVIQKINLREQYKVCTKNNKYPIEQSCFCFKDEMVTKDAAKRLNKELNNGEYKDLATHHKQLDRLIKNAGLHQLEFCRALHAEENAIIQNAKIGGSGINNGTIYTTAQPCTLCSKKIKQSGIKKVVYTDAYPKSLSDIFMDEVELKQFEGVKPRSYMKLFMANHDQKEWQDLEVQNAIPGFDFNEEEYLYIVG